MSEEKTNNAEESMENNAHNENRKQNPEIEVLQKESLKKKSSLKMKDDTASKDDMHKSVTIDNQPVSLMYNSVESMEEDIARQASLEETDGASTKPLLCIDRFASANIDANEHAPRSPKTPDEHDGRTSRPFERDSIAHHKCRMKSRSRSRDGLTEN